MCQHALQEAKKVLEVVLAQLSGLDGLPNSMHGNELSMKLQPIVQKLSKYLPDLQEIHACKKHNTMKSDAEFKVFLTQVAADLNEGMEIIKMGKALQK